MRACHFQSHVLNTAPLPHSPLSAFEPLPSQRGYALQVHGPSGGALCVAAAMFPICSM